MIRNFESNLAQDIFHGINSKTSRKISALLHDKIRRLFDQLDAATQINTLRIPPSNNLEKLKGDLKDFWGLRINKQWRIIFKWHNSEACEVDIIDYH